MSFNIRENLKERNFQIDRYRFATIDDEENLLQLICWSLSGNMTGYIQYRPDMAKDKRNDEGKGRYYIRRGEGFDVPWGLETYHYRSDILFIVEGIFSAVHFHNLNLPCISVLTNNPKPILNWLYIISNIKKLIVVPDNDNAGNKLVKYGHTSLIIPKQYKDTNDMSNYQFYEWISSCMRDGLLPNHLLNNSLIYL